MHVLVFDALRLRAVLRQSYLVSDRMKRPIFPSFIARGDGNSVVTAPFELSIARCGNARGLSVQVQLCASRAFLEHFFDAKDCGN